MELKVLAQNVRRIRTGKKMSQRQLAEVAGISLPALKNLETQKSEPRMRTVQAITKALGVRLQEVFTPVRELKTVRFRSGRRMQNRENILAEVARWLDDFNDLEKQLDSKRPFLLKNVFKKSLRRDVVKVAQDCRKVLGLSDTEPIHDICGLLEKAGIKVLPVPMASDGFFGLSLSEDDGGPAIAVNVWERISVERRIFSAAHELGHLMLHPDAYDVKISQENKDEETEADLFAGHFLMPNIGFQKEWNDAAGLHWVDRVMKVKRIYRVSYKTVLYRLLERGEVDNSIWRKFNYAYSMRFNRKISFKEEPDGMNLNPAEPYGLDSFDFYEDRFSLLARQAVEKNKISLGRGAEILGISIDEMQDILSN